MVQSAAEGEAAQEKKSDDERGKPQRGDKKKSTWGPAAGFFSEKKTMEKDFKPLGRRRRPPFKRKSCVF